MRNRATRVRAFIISVMFCASSVSGVFTFNNTSAQARENAKKPVHFGESVIIPDDPEAIYEGARIVHNVTVNGKKGMRVHAKFRVKYGLDVACMMIAYFYFDDADN